MKINIETRQVGLKLQASCIEYNSNEIQLTLYFFSYPDKSPDKYTTNQGYFYPENIFKIYVSHDDLYEFAAIITFTPESDKEKELLKTSDVFIQPDKDSITYLLNGNKLKNSTFTYKRNFE